MPITITGDMTQDEVDQAMINDLNDLLVSNAPGTLIQISHSQIERILELLGDKGKKKEIKSEVKAAARAAAPAAQSTEPKKTRAQLNEMTKEELVEYADDHDIDVTPSWPKADIVDAIVKHK